MNRFLFCCPFQNPPDASFLATSLILAFAQIVSRVTRRVLEAEEPDKFGKTGDACVRQRIAIVIGAARASSLITAMEALNVVHKPWTINAGSAGLHDSALKPAVANPT